MRPNLFRRKSASEQEPKSAEPQAAPEKDAPKLPDTPSEPSKNRLAVMPYTVIHGLHTHLAYLQEVVLWRLEHHFGKREYEGIMPEPPVLEEADQSPFAHFVRQREPSQEELLVLLIALAPLTFPHFFDAAIGQFLPKGGEFPDFGGVKVGNSRGTLPTGDTVIFLLAGNKLEERLRLQFWLRHHSFFNAERMVLLESVKAGEPPMSGRLTVEPELAEWLLTGSVSVPKFNADFPAQQIATELDWEDLVLDAQTLSKIQELDHWLQHHHTLLYDWEMHKRIKPGYRVLFYGPPGTGKTFTAMLLGKHSGLPVFRVDLSMIVSKYIGETEKNLSSLFDKAENKNWILFFDEADALFGKRTNVRDAHDKYANQEVSYLLQRIESYPGLVILASNFKTNMDEAFTRRFQSIIYFPIPKAPERLQLWEKAFPIQVTLDESIDLQQIAQKYELTGSNIINIVQYCCIDLLAKEKTMLSNEELIIGIQREYAKEDKVI